MKIDGILSHHAMIIFAVLFLSAPKPVQISALSQGQQPQSIICVDGKAYAPFGSSRQIHLSTATRPMPQNFRDLPIGNPVYFWDFGPLHGVDNWNGTATIFTDIAGSYPVTVYCEQEFIGPNGMTYRERTQKSAP